MNTLINLLKIYLGFFVENTVFSSIIYGLVFNIPIAVYFGITSYLNLLMWVYLKGILDFNFTGFTNLRPNTNLIIDTKIATVIYKFSKYGMPSLHSIYTGYCVAFWYLYKKDNNIVKNNYLSYLYILVVMSRLYFNVHTFGQVLVGSLIGFLFGTLSYMFYYLIEIFYFKKNIKY